MRKKEKEFERKREIGNRNIRKERGRKRDRERGQ